MIKLLKSQVDQVSDDFPAAVEAYRQALLDHRFSPPARQAVPAIPATAPIPAVKAQPAVPGRRGIPGKPAVPGRPLIPGKPAVPAIPAHPGEPRPTAHILIEACIGRVPVANGPDDFVVLPFEIIDDTPEEVIPESERDLIDK